MPLNLLPITLWHEYIDLLFLFKAVNGILKISSDVLPDIRKISTTTRSSANQNITLLNITKYKTLSYQRSYYIRTSRVWNELAHRLELSLTMDIATLKDRLKLYYTMAVCNTYDADDARSWKTICPSCNTARTLTATLTCCF